MHERNRTLTDINNNYNIPLFISRCSKLIAIILCVIQELHFKVRRLSVAGYTTDETLG